MFFFDPLYLVIMLVGGGLSAWAAMRVKGTFQKYSKMPTSGGMTGAQVAQRILQDNGITDVQVEPVAGQLTDHYDPKGKVLRLSEPVYAGRSMSALGVAAHEVGHAIQDAHGYAALRFRSAWVPVASTGSRIAIFVLIAAVLFGAGAAQVDPTTGEPIENALANALAVVGVLLFATTTIFTLVTLPVEFDASKRALLSLEGGRYMTTEELAGAKKVLDAAALTYVAAFIASALTLLYWLMRTGLLGGGRNQ